MANAYTIDKLPSDKKKAVKKAIREGMPPKTIATNYGVPPKCVDRYKNGVVIPGMAKEIAESRRDDVDNLVAKLNYQADDLTELLEALKRELKDRETQEYDLSDPRRARTYVELLNRTAQTLLAYLTTLAKITGDLKESVEIVNRPALILAQVGQIIQSSEGKEDMLDRLRTIQR